MTKFPFHRGSTVVGAFACVVAMAFAKHLHANAIPPAGLQPGSQYRLVFVTSDPDPLGLAPHPEAGQFGWYNNQFVTQEASLSHTLPNGIGWDLVTSAGNGFGNAVGPQDNLLLPVYDTAGNLLVSANTLAHVASNLAGSSFPSLSRPLYNQYGNLASSDSWFTGLNKLGTNLGGPVGGSDPNRVALSWNSGPGGPPGTNVSEGSYSFPLPFGPTNSVLADLAISSPITIPEPSSFALLGIGGIGLAMGAYRRHRMAAA